MLQLLATDLFLLPKEVIVEYKCDTKKEVNYYNDFTYQEAIDIYITPQDVLVNYVVMDTLMMIIFVCKDGKKEFKIYKEV